MCDIALEASGFKSEITERGVPGYPAHPNFATVILFVSDLSYHIYANNGLGGIELLKYQDWALSSAL